MPKRYDCIVIGAALVDVLAETGLMRKETMPGKYAEHRICLSLASKTLLKSIQPSPGGSALNVAVTMDGMGSRLALLSVLGKDVFGDYVIEGLKKTGISAQYIKRVPEETGVGISLISGGEKSSLVYHGAVDVLGEKDITPEMVRHSRKILITSLTSKSNYVLFLKALRLAKRHRVPVVFAPSITMLKQFGERIRKLNYKFDIVILNYEEGSLLTQKKEIKKILKSLPGRVAVVTKDSDGAYAREGGRNLSVNSLPIKVVNTTGVGDSFCGAFVHTYYKTGSLEKSLKAASAVAHMNLSTMETEIHCSPAQIAKFLKTYGKKFRVRNI